jgi:glycosyltransferase involved in cell wall biosynthesis
MRIAALMPERTIGSIYRSLVPMQALAHRGHEIHIEEREEIQDLDRLLGCDLVHVLMHCHPAMQQVARLLKQRGIAVVWDNDDHRTMFPNGDPDDPIAAGFQAQRLVAAMRTMIRTADVVTAPSPELTESYEQAGARAVRVLDNCLPPTFVRPERVMPHQGVVIGWVASPGHVSDFEQLQIRDTLERLLARHAHVQVQAVGFDVGIRSNRYAYAPWVAYGTLPNATASWDLALAPLASTDINHARSNVKLKEYAAVGLPWLASPIGPYAGMGEAQGGRLVADGDWLMAIDELLEDADTRRVLGQRGRRWADETRIEHHVEQWEQTFQAAVERARAAHAMH